MSNRRGFWPALKSVARPPIAVFSLLILASLAAACDLQTRQAPAPREFADQNSRRYQMYFDSSADPEQNVLQVRKFDGQVRMPDLDGIFGDVEALPLDDSCNLVAGPVAKHGRLWYLTATPDLVGANLVSLSPDGTKSSAFDLDGDREVDILDIELPDNRRASIIAEAVGLEPFLEWLKGNDPFCNTDLMKGLGLPDLGCTGSGGSAGGAGAGGPTAGFADPADSICAAYAGGPASSFLANSPTQSWAVAPADDVTTSRSNDGALRIEVTTDWFDGRTGEFLGTNKLITEYNPSDDSLVEIIESVDADGTGERTITVTESDGTRTQRTETFSVARDDAGQPGYDEALASPPSPGAPTEEEEAEQERERNESAGTETDPSQNEPGPEGDDSVIAEFCQRRENYQSGVEQAVQHDPSAISISCGDLVGAPSPNCKILEWAAPRDWRTLLEPPADNSCDAFDEPDKQCEGGTVEDRIRKFLGETAELWSLDTPNITMCSPLACDPANAAALRSYTSGEAVVACPAVADASTPISAPAGTSSVTHRCNLFEDMDIGFVTLDWQPGQPMTLYTSMPGGVPGLETPIEGDDQPVLYTAMWGDSSTEACEFIPGYPGRLYCTMAIPADYAGSVRPFELYLSGCESPIYYNPRAEVPGGAGSSGGSAGGACTLTQSDCTSQGLVLDSANCQCIVFQ